MLEIQENVKLAPLSTMQVGGSADYYIQVKSKEDMIEAIQFAKKKNIPYYIIGCASNIIFPDEGYRGLIIHNRIQDFEISGKDLKIGSGYFINEAIMKIMMHNLSGFEKLFGVPGSIGGAIFQNASAYKHEISETLTKADIYNVEEEKVETWNKEDFHFGYRTSKVKENPKKYVILIAYFYLRDRDKKYVEEHIKFVNQERHKRPIGASTGSFFKNPEGYFVGKLIEDCGLKGKKVGGAEVSPLHANYIMNVGNAKACDVEKLSGIIKDEVKKKFNIDLEEEVRIIKNN